jgi:hypothetical protein
MVRNYYAHVTKKLRCGYDTNNKVLSLAAPSFDHCRNGLLYKGISEDMYLGLIYGYRDNFVLIMA